jgi:hypothetical protein
VYGSTRHRDPRAVRYIGSRYRTCPVYMGPKLMLSEHHPVMWKVGSLLKIMCGKPFHFTLLCIAHTAVKIHFQWLSHRKHSRPREQNFTSRLCTLGFFSSARANATRCFSPPLNRKPRSPTTVLYPWHTTKRDHINSASFTQSVAESGLVKRPNWWQKLHVFCVSQCVTSVQDIGGHG